MEAILPGVLHWTAYRDTIRHDVHSYYHEPSGTVLDPMVPLQGLDEGFAGRDVQRIVLTNRHHYRQADAFRERFGCPVLCHEAGLHAFEPGEVEGFAFGDELAPGVRALEVGVITPEETAVLLDGGDGGAALALADCVIRGPLGELGFVPDELLGEDPAAVREGLRAALDRIVAQQRFDALLLAHGEPMHATGRSALMTFAQAPTAGAPPG
jgi:glyoxylase-like metal-dependent hydrolase (beta-lactamase superfamily II)